MVGEKTARVTREHVHEKNFFDDRWPPVDTKDEVTRMDIAVSASKAAKGLMPSRLLRITSWDYYMGIEPR